jgi:hypothetical protein
LNTAIDAQNRRWGWLVLKGWVFPLIGVAFLLGISWVVVWYQGRVIAENWVEISRQNKTLEQLAAKGGKLELSTCGKDQRLCVKMDLKELAYGREEESERGISLEDPGGVLNDGTRAAVIESVRELGRRVQSAARGLGERLQRFAADVRGHLYREPGIARERGELEQAGVALERSSRDIEPKIEALNIELEPRRSSMSLGREYREYGDREYGD